MAAFSRNVGGWDRAIRLLLGIVLLPVGIWVQNVWLIVLGALGLFSGSVGYCILYVPFGICTAPARKAAAEKSVL